jgi:type IV pilus assembly protein PilV
LQVVGIANNQSATLRTIATLQAYDLADRMRANLSGVNAGNYKNVAAADNACRAAHSNDAHNPPAICTAAQLAQDDLWDWNQANGQLLHVGSGTVCIDSTPDDGTPGAPACDPSGTAYAVKLWWNDKPTNSGTVITSLVSVVVQL